jgi:hypothetical protein
MQTLPHSSCRNYAMLLQYRGLPIVEHSGADAGYLVVQGEGKPDETWNRLPAYSLASDVQKDFVGGYYSEELDTSYLIEDRNGRLFTAQTGPNRTIALTLSAQAHYSIDWTGSGLDVLEFDE